MLSVVFNEFQFSFVILTAKAGMDILSFTTIFTTKINISAKNTLLRRTFIDIPMPMTNYIFSALLASAGFQSFAVSQSSSHLTHHSPALKRHRTHFGIASFYANKFNGRHTASGEIFNQEKMTAASNIIPMNTWVKVTNLHNRKAVIVKINDRMHARNRRLIDLSHAAAKKLGYTGWGLAKVSVEVLSKNKHSEQTEFPK